MTNFLKTAVLSALIGFGALASMPAVAQAQSGGVYLGFGNGHGPSVGFRFNDRGRHYDRDRRDRGERHERRSYRECSPREAMLKARRMGVRHPRVLANSHRSILIQGMTRGDRFTRVRFGKAPHCPVWR
jgi:hypothetical protein